VGLVADDHRVGIGDPLGVAHEPLVSLDRDRTVGLVPAVEERRTQPVAVTAVRDLADELFDQIAAVGEDQDAAGPSGLDEAHRGDRLAGAGGVLEPEPAGRARVVRRFGDLGFLLVVALVDPVLGLLVVGDDLVQDLRGQLLDVLGIGVGSFGLGLRLLLGLGFGSILVLAGGRQRLVVGDAHLLFGEQLGQRAGEGVHLVGVEFRAVPQGGRLLADQPFQSQQQREIAAPLDGGFGAPGVQLGDRGIEGAAARGAGRQRLGTVSVQQERFTRELRRALDVFLRRNRTGCGCCGGRGQFKPSQVCRSQVSTRLGRVGDRKSRRNLWTD
jgi:hypothetical protein